MAPKRKRTFLDSYHSEVQSSTRLVDFILGLDPVPFHKKRKVHHNASRQKIDSGLKLDHIVVKRTTWDIKCNHGATTPLKKSNVRPHIHWIRDRPEYLDILDDEKRTVFRAPLPQRTSGLEDVFLALEADHDSRKWGKAQGKLWTDFEIELLSKEGSDYLRVVFIVKWNVTTSPYFLTQATAKVKALSKLLKRYFPDQHIGGDDKWSPQDFYQSVHSPPKVDPIAASVHIEELRSTLYPFQKRAVQWLLKKEGVEWSKDHACIVQSSASPYIDLPVSFIGATDAQGKTCYVSHLFGIVATDLTSFQAQESGIRGGILAEEMGLGKTVEMISLISLNKRSEDLPESVYDLFTGQHVRPTRATLIIAPPSIARQWMSEISKHAPFLSVIHYQGIKGHSELSSSELLDALASSNIVISSYAVLAAEINFTQLNPERISRHVSEYPRPKSPLMALQFFRVVMDEAQMIESGVSNAALVARMVPRINAWCVTGTPVRKDVKDLLGLLVFLRYEPFASIKHVWSSLITSHKHDFRKIFGRLALRHSKQSVKDELKLPAQKRYVITMPFTPIEDQHYKELFRQMCEESNLSTLGEPLIEDWDPEAYSDIMRRWLVRLRQTALHPEVGGRNRRALGNKDGPLRTVDQVLDVMFEQTEVTIRTDQRNLLTLKMKRGQLFENSPRVKEALEIWKEAKAEAAEIVGECREQYLGETANNAGHGQSVNKGKQPEATDATEEQQEIDPSSRLGILRMRLRSALEIEHMATFFIANAYFQIKTNEEMTKPESSEFENLEKLETEEYESAKKLRQEILQEIYGKANKLMDKIAKKADTQEFVQIPNFPPSPSFRGLESRSIIEQLATLAEALDAQAAQLDEWREKTIQFLLRPLVDEDENGVEVTGDEYEESTKTQDEVMVYVQALRAVVSDRYDALTGQENKFTEDEVKKALKWATGKEGSRADRLPRRGSNFGGDFDASMHQASGAHPERTIELLTTRSHIKPAREMGSVRGVVSELRGLATSLRMDAQNGSTRAQAELAIVEKQLYATQKILVEQLKVSTALTQEVEDFTSVMNTRLEFYKQLQQVSDMVAPYEGPNDEIILERMLAQEKKLSTKIAAARSKRRYLLHLKLEAANPQEQRVCVICRDNFEVGSLTVCGHQYCKECIGLWWSAHRNCPVCKKKLTSADLHDITYKPQEFSVHAEDVQSPSQERTMPLAGSRKSAIYSEISKSKLAAIKNVDLDGPSFTTKVDTLARHLIWLRESDPGAKSIIYSQFKDFLDILARAFQRFRIGFSSIDKPHGIERFKQDPSVECFLLHARAHSSGLNLVNASHVFLCEPLLNTALELQAIARVDRIGQQQETNVWLYLVDGTVEESIHQLSVKRRMEHIGQRLTKDKGKDKYVSKAEDTSTVEEVLDANLEEANSIELQQASLTGLLAKGGKGGEQVGNLDLWDCVFGASSQKTVQWTLEDSFRSNRELSRRIEG